MQARHEIPQAVLRENVPSCHVQTSFKKSLRPHPDADEFQYLVISSLSAVTSPVKFARIPDQ